MRLSPASLEPFSIREASASAFLVPSPKPLWWPVQGAPVRWTAGEAMVSDVGSARAKLAGLRTTIEERIKDARSRYFDPPTVREYFEIYNRAAASLKEANPSLLDDLPERGVPEGSGTTDYDGRGYIERHHLELVLRDIG